MKQLPNRAGLVDLRTVRSTGTEVGLYRTADTDIDCDGMPWVTICETHGNMVCHETRTLAAKAIAHPEELVRGLSSRRTRQMVSVSH